MRRLLTFDFINGEYVVQEDSITVFSINGNDLQFDTRKFYEGIYKDNNASTNIDFENRINNDTLKKGSYIFQWFKAIFMAIKNEFNEPDDKLEVDDNILKSKNIILYDLAACAGDGIYIDGSDNHGEAYNVYNLEADFAVRISGQSMEPTIPDGSIVLVKKVEKLESGEIGIFNINGDAMCKRYTKVNDEVVLLPDNKSGNFKNIIITSDMCCTIQGKVIIET